MKLVGEGTRKVVLYVHPSPLLEPGQHPLKESEKLTGVLVGCGGWIAGWPEWVQQRDAGHQNEEQHAL